MGRSIVADIEGDEATQHPLHSVVCSHQRCRQQEEQTHLPFLGSPVGDCQHKSRYRQYHVSKTEEEVDTENRTEWNHHAPPLLMDDFGAALFVEAFVFSVFVMPALFFSVFAVEDTALVVFVVGAPAFAA